SNRTWRFWPIRSIAPQRFLDALARGTPLYDEATLNGYVEQDLHLLDEVQPDLVVGDFRLSLAVSAPLRGARYASVTNAYWSPYARREYPLPEIPIARIVGVSLATAVFRLLRPAIFSHHARPMNRLRRRYGLQPLGDLTHVYTSADHTLYADIPGLVPTFERPANHQYIGPIFWSPEVERPGWWDRLGTDRRVVYVTLGSSGSVDLLPMVARALRRLPVDVMVATAGRISLKELPEGAWAADYLPGTEAARRASLVVCNGGSPTSYQALGQGVPVLAIASNMDQHLMARQVAAAGAGLLLRAGHATERSVHDAAAMILDQGSFRLRAAEIAREMAQYRASARFGSLVHQWLG
ncbi:MAG: glycosyltransferase, partial [Gammaproteobacteria bacterium]